MRFIKVRQLAKAFSTILISHCITFTFEKSVRKNSDLNAWKNGIRISVGKLYIFWGYPRTFSCLCNLYTDSQDRNSIGTRRDIDFACVWHQMCIWYNDQRKIYRKFVALNNLIFIDPVGCIIFKIPERCYLPKLSKKIIKEAFRLKFHKVHQWL